MTVSSLFAALIALAPGAPQAAPTDDPAAQFAAGLAQVQQTAELGSPQSAYDGLHELLFKHRAAPWALARRLEIVDLATRCAFAAENPLPKLASLVSGTLVRWDPKSGDFEIRCDRQQLDDFELALVGTSSARIHPARFVDALSIEVEFGPQVEIGRNGPSIVVGLGTDETFIASFGQEVSDVAIVTTYVPASLVVVKDGKEGDVIDKANKPSPSYRRKGSLKVMVGSGTVTAYRDGKRVLYARRSTRESGQVALKDLSSFDRVTLKGRIQSSWPRGLIDAATRESREEFERRWRPSDHLPEWLFAGAGADAAAAEAPKAKARGGAREVSAAFAARVDELLPRRDAVTAAEQVRIWKELVAAFPAEPVAWIELACEQMRAGDHGAAQATCDAALAAGITAQQLDSLPQLLAKALTGPAFTRAFVHESANYVVKSDIDKAVCIEAGKALEESYRYYQQRLAPVADVEATRFRVFLFAGVAGYRDYAEETLGETPENTAGMYSRLLKQLLIWNLPDRAEMLRTVRHEGFHQYLDRLVAHPPVWFNEGMAEYFELAHVAAGKWTEGQKHDDHVALLLHQPGKWVVLDRLVRLDAKAFYGAGSELHYAQSWLVVHYLREGPKEARAQFDVFWRALLAGKSAEEATAAAFGGGGLGSLDLAARAWLRQL